MARRADGFDSRRSAPPDQATSLDPCERTIQLIPDTASMGTWEWDIAAGTVRWSPALEDMHGIPRGSFPGTFEAYQADIHPGDREHVFATIERTVKEKCDHRLEYRIVRPDGEVRWLEANGRVVCDEHGDVVRLAGICMDVSERKRAEAARLETESWFLTTLTSIGEAVITTDRQGRILLLNGVAEKLTGVRDEEARGRPLEDVLVLIGAKSRTPIENLVHKVRRSDAAVGLVDNTLLRQRDGREASITLRIAPINGADGELVGMVVVFRDVTEERQEAARRVLRSQASALLSATLDAEEALKTIAALAVPAIADWCTVDVLEPGAGIRRIAMAHLDPVKVAIADEIYRRYPPRPGPGSLYDIIERGESVLVPEITDEMLRAASQDDGHYQLGLQLGRLSSYLVVPIRVGSRGIGAISFVASGARPLRETDVLVAEELAQCAAIALENARLFLEARNATAARDQMLAVVAHDLRNLLGAMMLKLELLRGIRGESRTAMLERVVGFLARNSGRMKRMIDDLVDSTAVESGALTVEPAFCNFPRLIEQALETASAKAQHHEIAIATSIGDGLGTVHCDPERLLQVLSNLLDNAIKFTPRGGCVRVRAESRDREVLVSVEDTGPGIPEADRDQVFDRFYRGTKLRKEGLGLGLFIARGVIAAHSGRIWVEQGACGGAVFRFSLPVGAR